MFRAVVCPIVVLLSLVATSSAQDWANKMFDGLSFDFGSVARGAKVEHHFKIKNLYVEDVHIAGVRSSCGCTQPSITRDTLKTYEEAAVVAAFNTRDFLGQKSATITVTIDKPYYAQVQLNVTGYIRSDVVLTPGGVDFGTVDRGVGVERKLQIAYAGRDNWQILAVKPASPYVQASFVETSRGGGQVGYELTVKLLENAPAGYIKEQLILVTNDQRASQVPVDVEGRVTAELTASPSSLFLGMLQPGQKVTKQLVVQGKKPFLITGIRCDGECFEFKLSDAAKPVHLVPITFTAGTTPGRYATILVVETDMGDITCSIPATAQIVDPTASAGR